MLRLAEFAIGLLITLNTLVDVFSSIVVPGPSTAGLSVARHVRRITVPLWRYVSQKGKGPRRQLSNSLAPVLFFLAFATWMALLLVGFSLMFDALAVAFEPPLAGFDEAIYFAGSSLLTLGVTEVDAHGLARWVLLWAGLSGFAVITATITFILQIQTGLHEREASVLTLSGLAGTPASGIVLLENFAALGLRAELRPFFKEWRDWSTATLHSHVAHPMLVYFHSVDAESDWLSALHVVLDAATLILVLTEEDSLGTAAMMHRGGSRTAAHLCDLFGLENKELEAIPEESVGRVIERLREAGYAAKPASKRLTTELSRFRSDYAGRLNSLSEHLAAERVDLLPMPRTTQAQVS
jgi:hypothetical protein